VSSTLLVTGASGHLGRLVITHLLDVHQLPAGAIVATTRDPAKLADLASRGVKVRRADFEDPGSLAAAFAGIERVLLISTDALDRPGRRIAQHKTAVAAAAAAGVRHIVYTSMPQPDDSLIPFAPDHLGTEQAIEASGAGSTILRNAWYMENLMWTLPSVLASGKWYTSAGEGCVSYVSRDDCARVAAAALASTDAGNAVYDITGPELLTTDEIAAVASDVLGRRIAVVHVTDEQLAQGMVAAGMSEPMARFWTAFDANTRAGKVAILSDTVKRLTGRTALSMREFFAQHRDALSSVRS
jgi:NAD(P)H dehydrogenase (quinone)